MRWDALEQNAVTRNHPDLDRGSKRPSLCLPLYTTLFLGTRRIAGPEGRWNFAGVAA